MRKFFVAFSTLALFAFNSNAETDYEKLARITAYCDQPVKPAPAGDYILVCDATDELVGLSKKEPDAMFMSGIQTGEDAAKLIQEDSILVNVIPAEVTAQWGQTGIEYRVQAHGVDMRNLPKGWWAVGYDAREK